MTVNEVEQAIRNLMMNQPMISAGPMGGMVNSAISILESYRAFTMSVQTYPVQDNFKFGMMAEMQRFENNLTMSVCQAFQEKGINIMAYMMGGAGMMQNPYMQPMGMQQPMSQPVQGTHSHLAFNQPQAPRFGGNRPAGQFQPQFGMGNAPMNGQPMPPQYPNQPPMGGRPPMAGAMPQRPPMGGNGYPNYQQQPPMGGRPPMTGGMPQRPPMGGGQPPKTYPRTPAPAQPIKMDNAVAPTPAPAPQPAPAPAEVEIPMPTVQPSKATLKTQELSTAKPAVTKAPSKKPPILLETEPDMGAPSDEQPSGPAAGRDYLLQLLKK